MSAQDYVHKLVGRAIAITFYIFAIQVHNRKAEIGDDLIYETELLGPIAQSVYDQNFFRNLDTQLNKVSEFYKTKEQEFVQRGILLDKQICALTGVKKLLEQDRLKSLTVQVEDSTMRSGGALGKYDHLIVDSLRKLHNLEFEIVSPCQILCLGKSGLMA